MMSQNKTGVVSRGTLVLVPMEVCSEFYFLREIAWQSQSGNKVSHSYIIHDISAEKLQRTIPGC